MLPEDKIYHSATGCGVKCFFRLHGARNQLIVSGAPWDLRLEAGFSNATPDHGGSDRTFPTLQLSHTRPASCLRLSSSTAPVITPPHFLS
jgi:hypothetical protein